MARAFRWLPLLLAGIPASCAGCPPETYARVLAPDFDSPREAGRSFLAALACDEAEAEYRCLGESLKRRYGASLDLYLLARPQLRDELGSAVRYADRLQPTREESRPEGMLLWWSALGAERVGMLFEAQGYFDVTLDDGRRRGATVALPLADYLQLDRRRLRLELEDSVLRGVDPARVVHVEFGLEWKIAEFLPPEETPRP